MKHRIARVREVLRRELGMLIEREFTFPGLLVTVKDVDITPDLKQCHVFVSVIGPEKMHGRVISQLTEARSELQRGLAKRVVLKFTPVLNFKLDNSAETGVRILQILGDIGLDVGPNAKVDLPEDPENHSDYEDHDDQEDPEESDEEPDEDDTEEDDTEPTR
jgi:ribosome-binding factor A